uniref:Ribosomal protein S9 n=1 Tax=Panagrolaimus sp. JU765 TaxID=591449 RepID=A0AC34QC17_9BILA
MLVNKLLNKNLHLLSKQVANVRILGEASSTTQLSVRGVQTEQPAEVPAQPEIVPQKIQLRSIGKALERYLKNVREHEKMMEKERAEFELGKRYLANIMGWDPSLLTQEDIDKAIEYLFPSGLTDLKARPVMKPPEEILPVFHKFEFDKEGKPKNTLFYTLKPKFYGLLSDIGRKTQNLVKLYDEQLSRGIQPESEAFDLHGSSWISHKDLQKKLGEKLSLEMHAQLIIALEYLASLPLASREKEFMMEYKTFAAAGSGRAVLFGPEIPKVQIDPVSNRRLATVVTKAKAVKVEVTVRDAGTGKYTVDGHHYDVFRSVMARENLIAPLLVTDMFGRVDIEARVLEGPYGLSIVPRAVRHGASLGIAALFPETVEKLKTMEMLTMEPRKKERSKVNQPGARAKWIWKRR